MLRRPRNKINGDGDDDNLTPPDRPMVFPGHFVMPSSAPLFIEATPQKDDNDQWWVMIRAEHRNGTFACFLSLANAISFGDDFTNALSYVMAKHPEELAKIQQMMEATPTGLVIPDLSEGIELPE